MVKIRRVVGDLFGRTLVAIGGHCDRSLSSSKSTRLYY
jgi:hypothetical protein